jgi:hypothetical protein
VFEEVRTAVAILEVVARELDPALFEGRDAAVLLEVFGRGERVCAAAKTLLARRGASTRRASGARTGIEVRRIGWQKRPRDRWRRMPDARHRACTRAVARNGRRLSKWAALGVAGCRSDVRRGCQPERRRRALGDGRVDEREGPQGSLPAGARRRRGRRSGVGAPPPRASAGARLDRSRWRVLPERADGARRRRAIQLGVERSHRPDLPTRAAPGGANPELPMPPMRSSRWPAKVRASR